MRAMKGLEKLLGTWKVGFEGRGGTLELLPWVHRERCVGGSTEGGTRGKRHKQNVEISEVLLLGKKQEQGVKSLILNEEGRITTPPRPRTRKAFVDTSYVHLCSFE